MKKNMNMLKSQIIYQKLIFSQSFRQLTNSFRSKINIPEEGFKNLQEEIIWSKENYEKSISIISQYIDRVLRQFPDVPEEFIRVLLDYLFFGSTNQLESINLTGCDILLLDNESLQKVDSRFEEGVYIKVSPYATFIDLKKFINKERHSITQWQKHLISKKNLKKKKRVRNKPNFARDISIYYLNSLSRDELIEMGCGNSKYKDIQISNYLKTYEDKVSCENIRKIISQQRKLYK